MHHIAFSLSQAMFAQTVERLDERGIRHSGVKDRGFMDSIYFEDPLGLLIELASYRFEPPFGHTHSDVLLEAHKLREAARRPQHRRDPPGRRHRGHDRGGRGRRSRTTAHRKTLTRRYRMATMKLHVLKPSVNNLTVRIFVRAAGLDFEEIDVWGSTHTPEFLAKNPAHLTPMIEHAGLPRSTLWESCAIMAYLCNTHGLEQFYPSDPGKRAMIDSANFYLIGTLYPLRRPRHLSDAELPPVPGRGGLVGRRRRRQGRGPAGRRGGTCRAARRLPGVLPRRQAASSAATIPRSRTSASRRRSSSWRSIDYDLPDWAKEFMEAMADTLGDAYTEPAADVRGYIEYVSRRRRPRSHAHGATVPD